MQIYLVLLDSAERLVELSVSRLPGMLVNERDARNLIFHNILHGDEALNLVEESGHSSQLQVENL